MRMVITGGAGFIGSHLCDYLIEKGHEVICIDNLLTGKEDNICHLIGNGKFRFIKHNVSDYIYVDGNVDCVLHFASPASPFDYLEVPIQTLKVASLGTLNSLGLAKSKKARFLLASTSEVYGDPQIHPQREDYWGHVNPVGPRGVYDEAKRFAEAMTMAYHRYHHVDGIYRLLLSKEHEPVNMGNPAEITILQLAKEMLALTGSKSKIVFKPLPVDDPKIRQPDITKAKRVLGWEPRVSREEGLRKTLVYFKNLLQKEVRK